MKQLLLVVLLSCLLACCCAQQQDTFIVQYEQGARNTVMQATVQQGCSIVREYQQFQRLVVSCALGSPSSDSAQPAAVSVSAMLTQQLASLQALDQVTAVHKNGWIQRPKPVPDSEVQLQAGGPAASSEPNAKAGLCGLGDPLNPDAGLGIKREGVPYGITLTQSDTPEMRAIAKEYRDKVMWCVIDTGLDINNQEFDKERTSGCIGPGASGNLTSRNSFKYCYNWWDAQSGHGTHTSGTVAALRNGRGVVGVSPEGAHLYHYNIFGPHDQEPVDLTVAAWLECIDELDRRKASTGNADMKLVISMSFGVDYPNEFAGLAIKNLTAERKDVLWLASAGNSGDATMGYPAGYPEIMSVGAVDWNSKVASFSTRNSQVDITAPGVKTVSTVPLKSTANSDYYLFAAKDVVTTNPRIVQLTETPDFFSRPSVSRITGTTIGSVTAPLVDCGKADAGACSNAAGKVCLIQRGGNTFCAKAAACVAGSGTGMIMYNSDDKPDCERFSADVSNCTEKPAAGWPVAVALSSKQGKALQSALAAGPIDVTLAVPSIPAQKEIGLAAFSGTSMACPTAAGVAGLVWSAHTDCTSTEIRAALEKSARRPASRSADVQRDDEYGHGVIQALAAHQYLQQHPCSGA